MWLRVMPAVAVGSLLMGACSSPENTKPASTTETTAQDQSPEIVGFEVVKSHETDSPVAVSLEQLGIPGPDYFLSDSFKIDKQDDGRSVTGYAPLMEVALTDEKVILTDVSPSGVNEDIAQWFTRRMGARAELVSTALSSGSIEKILIVTHDDYGLHDESTTENHTKEYDAGEGFVFGYFDPDTKRVVLDISPYAFQLNPGFIEQYLTHELSHALFAGSSLSYFSDKTPEPASQAAFNKACETFRSYALEQIVPYLDPVTDATRRFAEGEQNPDLAARYSAVVTALQDGTWKNLQPTPENNEVLSNGNPENLDKEPNCAVARPGNMAFLIGEQQGLPEPDKLNLDSNTSGAFDEMIDGYNELIRTVSNYRVFTEATYEKAAALMGHPADNWDELAASVVNTVISYPQSLAEQMDRLEPNHKEVALQIVRLVTSELVKAHPELKPYIMARQTNLESYLQ